MNMSSRRIEVKFANTGGVASFIIQEESQYHELLNDWLVVAHAGAHNPKVGTITVSTMHDGGDGHFWVVEDVFNPHDPEEVARVIKDEDFIDL